MVAAAFSALGPEIWAPSSLNLALWATFPSYCSEYKHRLGLVFGLCVILCVPGKS